MSQEPEISSTTDLQIGAILECCNVAFFREKRTIHFPVKLPYEGKVWAHQYEYRGTHVFHNSGYAPLFIADRYVTIYDDGTAEINHPAQILTPKPEIWKKFGKFHPQVKVNGIKSRQEKKSA